MRGAAIDSGPLISLAHLELAKELALFFNNIYVLRAVQLEVNRKHRFRYKLQKLYGTGIYAKCLLADRTNVDLHRIEVDDGEAEGPAQAQETNADAFLGDESRAREIGMNLGLRPVGTVRILARLGLEGRAGLTTTLVRKLRSDLRLCVSDEVIQAAIAHASEPI